MYEYDRDAMFRGAAALAAIGWKLVRLHGVRDGGQCTCSRPTCSSIGKHPSSGSQWHLTATDSEDEIGSWFHADGDRANAGVLLGAASGIIDVEHDDEDARQAITRWGLDEIDTPAYSSGRGVHRIFQYEPWMPDAAVIKIDGIEIRLGGGGRAAQSVIPPSTHHSGTQYRWLPGRSPDDVPPARLPDRFREAVMSEHRHRAASGAVSMARQSLIRQQAVATGGRHQNLVGIASHHAKRIPQYTENELAILTATVESYNQTFCVPPKPYDEVIAISRAQFHHYRQRKESRAGATSYERYGMEYDENLRCWTPGLWRMTILHSDPPEYRLYIPRLGEGGAAYVVRLSPEIVNKPRAVASAILCAAPRIHVEDPSPAMWSKTWSGGTTELEGGGQVHTRGVLSMLFDAADEEWAPAEYSAAARVAGIVLAYLDGFAAAEVETAGDEDRSPNENGAPKWIRDPNGEWHLWLKWHETCGFAEQRRGGNCVITAEERRTLYSGLLAKLNAKKFPERRASKGNAKRSRYLVWDKSVIDALRSIAGDAGTGSTDERSPE